MIRWRASEPTCRLATRNWLRRPVKASINENLAKFEKIVFHEISASAGNARRRSHIVTLAICDHMILASGKAAVICLVAVSLSVLFILMSIKTQSGRY
jgi:hypothetical protein